MAGAASSLELPVTVSNDTDRRTAMVRSRLEGLTLIESMPMAVRN